jgi:hypothetical protein
MRKPPEICPQCGAEVPPDARACPECGSDYRTGWSERAVANRLDLPDEDFDYDDFVAREFGGRPTRGWGPRRLWWFVALILALLFLAGFVF